MNKKESDNKVHINIGIHDHYDQIICSLAKDLGIDTIIFQHEIGETRSVSEILDIRTYSYDHLVRIVNKYKEDNKDDENKNKDENNELYKDQTEWYDISKNIQQYGL